MCYECVIMLIQQITGSRLKLFYEQKMYWYYFPRVFLKELFPIRRILLLSKKKGETI